MKILLLGCRGQVGWELQRALAPLGQVVALDHAGAEGLCGNFSDADGLRKTVDAVAPDVIVNAAAHTAVDKAESEPDLARSINADAVTVLAEGAARRNAWLVHYSTDYVFDGSGTRPWQEDDATGPLSVYGQTKLAGEQAILASGCAHLIFRTSWVYAARGGNFARTMLRLAGERERLAVIADQIGAPTGADLIADVTAHALRMAMHQPDLGGTYHLVASGETSWHAYAGFVFETARALGSELKVTEVVPIPTADYPTPATRPLNSRLDTGKLQRTFGLHLPPWQRGVARMLNEIL